jgi:putative hemolysin
MLTNVTINVAYFVICTVLLMHAHEDNRLGKVTAGVLSVASLLTLILLGEVLPKLLAARLTARWVQFTALPLMAVHRLLTPLRIVFGVLILAPLSRLIAPQTKPQRLSPDEFESILEQSRQRGAIDRQEEHLLQQVLELSQLKVRDLMIPRVDIKAFDLEHDPAQLFDLVGTSRYRHIPVYRRNLDQIEGVVHTRQLLLTPRGDHQAISKLVRQVYFVPEQQRADQLLAHFRRSGTKFAIVVDEYGGTAGMITLEDVVEHLVGQIAGPDEMPQPPQVQPLGPGRWRVGADLSIHEWDDVFDHHPLLGSTGATTAAGLSTLGGLVMAQLGRLPKVDDQVTLGDVVVTVESMQGRRIEWVTIQLGDASKPLNPTDKPNPPQPTDTTKGGGA